MNQGEPETTHIDKLFLELSQFSKATTGKEFKAANALKEAKSLVNEIETIWLNEWQSAMGVDTPLSDKAQTKLHQLRQKLYRLGGS